MVGQPSGGERFLLPTVLFILGVYILFAILNTWSRRASRRLRCAHRVARPHWLPLTCGLLALAGAAWLALRAAPCAPPGGLSLAGVLGGLEMGSLLPAKTVDSADSLPVKNPDPGDRPTYALLHPETPASLLLPEKPAAPAPLRKPRLKGHPVAQSKKAKATSKPLAKEKSEKAPGKARVKKKKPASAPAKPGPIQQAYHREG